METVQQTKQAMIDFARLKSALLARRIMRQPFKLRMSMADLEEAVLTAYEVEVVTRGHKAEQLPEGVILPVAKWLHDGNKVGLFLCGLCGNGKTTMMRAVCNLIDKCWDTAIIEGQPRERIHTTTAKDITDNATDPKELKYAKTYPMLAIDDLGCEPVDVKQYGNVISPMIDVMNSRYDSQLFTIITSNLTPAEISQRYGDRMADRFREMFAIVNFTNNTYRHG